MFTGRGPGVHWSLRYTATGRDRQVQCERGALPRLALDRDGAAALIDDPVDHRETQAAALADGLRRKERLERALQGGAVHAMPGVFHDHDGIRAGRGAL